MCTCPDFFRRSPIAQTVYVEALLLLPINQGIRWRLKELCREYTRIRFNHSDPYAAETDLADTHPQVMTARRQILAVELLMTAGEHEIAGYRKALRDGDYEEAERIELAFAEWVKSQLDIRPDDLLASFR